MKISTKGRYALRMLLDMAEHQQNGYVTLRDIAQRQEISKKYLEQIALTLGQAGVLRGTRGHQGGYCLVGEPKDYSVYEILCVTEGSMAPVACLDQSDNLCQRCDNCRTLVIWQGLDRLIQQYLSGITLQDILDGNVQLPEKL